jgi:hypothetical protein
MAEQKPIIPADCNCALLRENKRPECEFDWIDIHGYCDNVFFECKHRLTGDEVIQDTNNV